MTRIRTGLVALFLIVAAAVPAISAAQNGAPVRFGQNYTLAAGETTQDVIVIFGNADISGQVLGDLVVLMGNARLASTASVGGDFLVIGGVGTAASGATVGGDAVVLGGGLDAPADFKPHGESFVLGSTSLAGQLNAFVPWITRGLLWGRPIVPDLPWVWGVVGVFFLVYLAINTVFDRSVRVCAEALGDRPLTAFAIGLLVLLLAGPVCALLAVSVVGLVVVPFVLCALVVAALVGKVAVGRWIGAGIVRREPGADDTRMHALVAFVIGSAIIIAAYIVPLLGFVVWALSGVLGVGAAALAFVAAYRRENPSPPRTALPAGPPPFSQPAEVPSIAGASTVAAGPASGAGPQPSTTDLTVFPRASFRDRLAAFVLDILLVVLTYQMLDVFRRGNTVFLVLLAYHIAFWAWKGATIGGIICQLRVVRVDGAPLRPADALVRGLSSLFSLAVLGIGCLWILKDPERQAWHDKIAGTYVVKVPRNWPL